MKLAQLLEVVKHTTKYCYLKEYTSVRIEIENRS